MMNETESARSMIENSIANPKVAAAIAAGTTGLGAAARMDLIQGWLSIISMCVGIVTGLLIAGWWAIRLEKAWRNRHSNVIED
jgi:purine-cytosine permease-like protein